eukprot:COSAG06_NODE_2540_length_6706_cov_9.446647_10_plen_208_part_00
MFAKTGSRTEKFPEYKEDVVFCRGNSLCDLTTATSAMSSPRQTWRGAREPTAGCCRQQQRQRRQRLQWRLQRGRNVHHRHRRRQQRQRGIPKLNHPMETSRCFTAWKRCRKRAPFIETIQNDIDSPRQARDKHIQNCSWNKRGSFWCLQVKAVRYVRDNAAAEQPRGRSGKGGAPPEKTIGGGGGGGEGMREEFLVSWDGYPVRTGD